MSTVDMYAWVVVLRTSYEPSSVGGVFSSLKAAEVFANLVRKYGSFTNVDIEEFVVDSPFVTLKEYE